MYYLKIIFELLSKKDKYKLLLLQFVFLVGATLQIVAISSLAPFIALISDGNAFDEYEIYRLIIQTFNLETRLEILTATAIGVVTLITINNTYSAIALKYLFRYSMNVGREIQNRLFRNYIHQTYIFFAKNNSADLVANITSEVPRLVYMVILPLLHIASEIFVALIIIGGLIYVDPIMALGAALFICSIYLAIYQTIRVKISESGKLISRVAKRKIKLINESIGGIKEVKMLGAESLYRQELDKATYAGLNASAFIGLAGDLPRYIVETCVFAAILVLAIFLFTQHGESSTTISILSFYVMAGYKLVPAIQTIYKSISSIKANGSVAEKILNEVKRTGNFTVIPAAMQENSEIRNTDLTLRNVSYRYPSTQDMALSSINIAIPKNTVAAFVGASGAGKSTAVDIILGLLQPTEGTIEVGNQIISNSNIRSWQNQIGYVPQEIFLLDDSVKRNIAFGIPENEIDLEQVIEAAKKANIHEFIEKQEEGYDFIVGERGMQLSGGQIQRIGIARALYKKPNVIIFDEATSALDTVTEQNIMKEIIDLRSSASIIMIAHRLSTVLDANQIFFFENGTITGNGTFDELKNQHRAFNQLATAAGY